MSDEEGFKWVAEKWQLAHAALSFEEILKALTPKVEALLTTDRRKLFQAFYRLDVDEARVERVFRTRAPHEQARALAELILERELQKARTRHGAE
jgi:hypothetical protein